MRIEDMRPAFASLGPPATMALALAFFLALPLLDLFSVPEAHLETWRTNPTIPYVYEETFRENGPIDVLIVGSSREMHGLRPDLIRERLSRELGREAVVCTFGMEFRGEDAVYMLLKNVLARRPVKMVVLAGPLPWQDRAVPHPHAHRLWMYEPNAEAYDGLPLSSRLAFYACSVLGSPRHLLSLVRPNVAAGELDGRIAGTGLRELRGACASTRTRDNRPFRTQTYPVPAWPVARMIRSTAGPGAFVFTGPELDAFQSHFHRLIGELAGANGVKLVYISIPPFWQARDEIVRERADWVSLSGAEKADLVGLPPAVLFRDVPEDELSGLYWDDNHLNNNGAVLFTQAILPALVEAYER